MYKNIIFDFYGTLVDIKTDETTEQVWKKLSLFMAYNNAVYDSSELKAAYKKILDKYMGRYSGSDYPDVDVTDVFYRLYLDKKVQAKPRLVKSTTLLFRALSTEYIFAYEGVEGILKELKKKGKKIFLLSNAQRAYLIPELKMVGLDGYFDGIYISSDEHICKPDEEFYKTLMNKEKIKKSETIMVGNEYSTDIKGANKAGIDSLFIMTESTDRKSKKVDATYSILDGDHKKIIKVLIKG